MRLVLKKISTLIGVASFLFLATGCNTSDTDERLLVTVSIPPQQWLVEKIGGERVKVNCLLNSGSDPENTEPSIHQMAELYKSALYFTLGGLPFEEALIERTQQNHSSLLVVNSAEGIELLEDECHGHHHEGEGHNHGHEGFDPHIWTSPENCRIIAANIERRLSELDPEGAEYYHSQFLKVDSVLENSNKRISSILDGCSNRTIMTWHPSLGYFARDYNLIQLSVQQEGKEVTPRQLANAIKEATKYKPSVLFYDVAQQGNETSLLESDLNLPVQPLRLMEKDFIPQLILAAEALRDNQSK